MTEVVADASALVDALTAARSASARHLAGCVVHAPHLVDVEVTHALRSLTAAQRIEQSVAVAARTALLDVVAHRYGHEPLLPRMWDLRHAVSTYDAAYVALAELLDVPLLTLDARLARANGIRCAIEVV